MTLPQTVTVGTYNLNGIRAATKRGFADWWQSSAPDILTMQEVRAPDAVLRSLLPDGVWCGHHESTIAGAKGRAGVALCSAVPPVAHRDTLAGDTWAGHGRWIEADYDTADGVGLTLISAYVHSGEVDTPKQDAKYAFLEDVTARLAELAQQDRHVLLTGDINIGHHEADIKNWKGNVKRAGFLPKERAYLDRWVDDLGYVDVVRQLAGPGPGPYSWWSWRGKAFDNDAGWRIDYHFATPGLAKLAERWQIDRAESYDTRVSDHAPVLVTYQM